MNIIAPIFLILASLGIFYGYTDSHYRGSATDSIVSLREENSQYNEALQNSSAVIDERNKLVQKNNNLASANLARLQKLLPDHVDNVRLIIDIDGIASRYGLNIRNIKLDNDARDKDILGVDNNPYGTITLKFSVIAPYDEFRSFVSNLEDSLRIVDISNISFKTSENGYTDYSITLKTYWLK